MTIIVTPRLNKDGSKTFYTFEWGKGAGERRATGIFTYVKPKDQLQRNHNKEARFYGHAAALTKFKGWFELGG